MARLAQSQHPQINPIVIQNVIRELGLHRPIFNPELVYYMVIGLWQLCACLIFRHIPLPWRFHVATSSMVTGLRL